MKVTSFFSTIIAAACAIMLSACAGKQLEADYNVVPLPYEISMETGDQQAPFILDKNTVITYSDCDSVLAKEAQFLSDFIAERTNYNLAIEPNHQGGKAISLVLLKQPVPFPECYTIKVQADSIIIEAPNPSGIFYGIQTIRKAIPADAKNATITFPAATINDKPRFGYRGMHLDVARHFFTIEEVKQYIDLLALHNMNRFHWHLTDDQGWRVEIKKHPRLTEVGSVRHRTLKGLYGSGEWVNEDYGGYYTQEQLKDVVAYAAARHITVVPEIDLPGHMLGALAAYPELGCTGGPYEVEGNWGVFDDVLCMGNDKTMEFLEDVMTEIMEIFPSKYIHIGGDECPKVRWHDCPKCQARIKAEGIKADEKHTADQKLQSWCMARVEAFLNEHGRSVIGWDELLEGDVAPNATIMSWRGSSGGIQAAQMGHDVIMTPNSHCYFDYYQTENTSREPLSIGGYVPINKVYSLEPTDGLTPEQAEHIIGVQANLWTEYISEWDGVLFRVLPRMDALSEVQWVEPDKKDYNNFAKRVESMLAYYSQKGLTFCNDVREAKMTLTPNAEEKAVIMELNVNDDAPIFYTLDGSEPSTESLQYKEPVKLTETANIKARAIRMGNIGAVTDGAVTFSKATLKPISFVSGETHSSYTYKGAPQLVDGLTGTKSWNSGLWLGFYNQNIELLIDLEEETEVKSATANCCIDLTSWIDGIQGLEAYVSTDGTNFTKAGEATFGSVMDTPSIIKTYEVTFAPVKARYVKLKVISFPGMPKGHSGEGQPGFYFIDEITVN